MASLFPDDILSPRQRRRRLDSMRTSNILEVLGESQTSTSLQSISQKCIRHWSEIWSSSKETTGPAWSEQMRPPTIHSHRPRVTVLINYNNCVPQWGCVEMARRLETNWFALYHVPSVARQSQVKGSSPIEKQIWTVFPVLFSCVLSNLSPVPALLLKVYL